MNIVLNANGVSLVNKQTFDEKERNKFDEGSLIIGSDDKFLRQMY
jgi:hypothetical protein